MLDLEKTGNLSKQRLLAWTLAWLGQIDARTGVEPFLYTSPLFWKGNLGDSTAAAAAGTGLWIAHWTSKSKPLVPAQNWNGNGWKFWQWTNCVSVPGIKHCTDGDRMNGTKLASVAIEPFPTGPPPSPTPPTIVGAPEAGQLLAAVPGLWEGGKPLTFTYQWRRCDAAGANCVAISGATARVVPAGQRRRGALAQGLRDRDVRGGNGGPTTGPDRRRHPGGHPAGRPPDQPQAAADRSARPRPDRS